MTRTKTLILGTTLALALGLAGCAHQPSNAQIGTGAGAVAGGLLGDAVFGTTLGTIGGAAAGAVIGNEIGKRTRRPLAPKTQKAQQATATTHYDRPLSLQQAGCARTAARSAVPGKGGPGA